MNESSSQSEAHVAFPGTQISHVSFFGSNTLISGGRTDEGDEGGMYTAMRQTWEETGLDLAESAYTPIGQLDDREITTSLGKRLLMILSPYVFLQLTPQTTALDPALGTTLHWVPLTELLPDILTTSKDKTKRGPRRPRWSSVTVDASSRLAPRHSPFIRLAVRMLVGSMQYPALVIDPAATTVISAAAPADEKAIDEKRALVEGGQGLKRAGSFSKLRRRRCHELKLWGLSLGMTLDLLAFMTPPADTGVLVPPDAEIVGVPVLAPSLTSVFPRFSYPDVNFWIWYVVCADVVSLIPRYMVLTESLGCSASGTARSSVGGRRAYAQAERTTEGT